MKAVKPKIYISAPITGYDLKERRESFARWARVLFNAGCEPVNPMEKGLPDEAPYKEHMKTDIKLLMDCDGFVLDNRWICSRGCKCEVAVAEACELAMIGRMNNGELELDMDKFRQLKSKLRKR